MPNVQNKSTSVQTDAVNTRIMVQVIYNETNDKAKGSEELRKQLKRGDITKICEHFGLGYTICRNAIIGKHFTDKDVVECAVRIAGFYKMIKLEETVKQIIESYVVEKK